MAGPLLDTSENRRSFRRKPMSDINVVPFIDVMLVLLVVFMITAPMMTQGVDVSLPEAQTAAITNQTQPLQVSIKSTGAVFIQELETDPKDLPDRLKAIKEAQPNASILLRADRNVDYGAVMQVMAALQNAGLTNVSLVTEPVGSGH